MKRLQEFVGLCLLVVSLAALTGCYVYEEHPCRVYVPPGPVVYGYYYYPGVEVYFDPHRHLYWWHEGEVWRSGPRAPARLALRAPVHVELGSAEPFRHHAEVRARYPYEHREERERR